MARLLLVEDVPVVRATLVKFLERGGHAVTTCAGGSDAWQRLRADAFDAVVTDLWMLDGDGLELIRRMQAAGDQTPVIAITGGDPRSPQSTSIEVALAAGARHALLKPITKATLLAAVEQCLGATAAGAERTV